MPTLQEFKIARAKMDESVKDVAERFDFSPQYIYEVLKYPNKNPELYRKIAAYCEENK